MRTRAPGKRATCGISDDQETAGGPRESATVHAKRATNRYFGEDAGAPVSSGDIREGMRLRILRVAKDRLPLSSSVTDPSVYPVVEKALGIEIVDTRDEVTAVFAADAAARRLFWFSILYLYMLFTVLLAEAAVHRLMS